MIKCRKKKYMNTLAKIERDYIISPKNSPLRTQTTQVNKIKSNHFDINRPIYF